MALALETKNEILFLLGYPAKTIIESSNLYNSIIADRLSDLDTFTEDRIESMLKDINAVRVNMTALKDQGKLKQVGDIVFNTDTNDRTVKSEYKRLLKELSRYLDISLKGIGSSMVNVCV